MIETRDPISEWGNAIKSRLITAAGILMLLAVVLCLIAPVFGPAIKQAKRRKYVMEQNYEELAEQDMKSIRIVLWMIAVVAWVFLIVSNLTYWG